MRPYIMACINERPSTRPSCAGRGSEGLANALETRLKQAGVAIEVRRIRCFGSCELGPNMRLAPGGSFFRHVDEAALDEIVEAARKALAETPADESSDDDNASEAETVPNPDFPPPF
ncbi:(2Fe-2S) ferredoxin domain-containing protein [Magnetofaba australis]|uniref:(2Fe-2S) ferredoxin domain-containing protein n=1 Tax=Magnetofaba australis TaxID=1472297 RepID=UPI000A19DD01|nr:(2Fe-2S) ferredoxin domain-containing protein [Magnetofaba australis]